LLKKELGVDAEIVEGKIGEFSVWVGDRLVSRKGWIRFPSDQTVLEAVTAALRA
jgi:hypothetical protein